MNINHQVPPKVAFLIIIIIALFSVILMEIFYSVVIKDIENIAKIVQEM